MADLADLIQKLSFYQAGGKDPGNTNADAFNQGFGMVKNVGDAYLGTIKQVLANKQAKLDAQKTQNEITKGKQEITPFGQRVGLPTADQAIQQQTTRVPENIFPQPFQSQDQSTMVVPSAPVAPMTQQRQDFTKANPNINPDLTLSENKDLATIYALKGKGDLLKTKVWFNPVTLDVKPIIAGQTIPEGYFERDLEKGLSEAGKLGLQNNKTKQGDISPEAKELFAEQTLATGQMPAGLGFGASLRIGIMNRAAELAKERGLSGKAMALQAAAYGAGKTELSNVQKNRGQILAFENTANRNLDVASALSDQVDRSGIPIINKYIIAGKKAIQGDPATAQFDAAIRTAINEYARVVTTVTGGGVTSDSARKEIEDQLNSAQNPEQIKAIINTLKTEMENRRLGYEQEIGNIQAQIGSLKPGSSTVASSSRNGNVSPTRGSPKPGGVLHEDANGNKAWMYPDGTYDEVK